ncbi:hypothetical protein Tcan_09877 [Toxocara canis]|uniref:Uncharacterized protein n=1 Tax=Toxocara canis TaxID=6265 RepID=A0A0B2VBA3_TOXCA|nr:hypothetical protein Tcan_09877 [Toxocara canis]
MKAKAAENFASLNGFPSYLLAAYNPTGCRGVGLMIRTVQATIATLSKTVFFMVWRCLLYDSIDVLAMHLIQTTTFIIALDRFIVIVFPLTYRRMKAGGKGGLGAPGGGTPMGITRCGFVAIGSWKENKHFLCTSRF